MRIPDLSAKDCALPAHELVLPSSIHAPDPLFEMVRTLISNAPGLLTRTGYRT